MAKLDLTKYGITGTTEIVYNPSYEQLFEEETKPGLEELRCVYKGTLAGLPQRQQMEFDQNDTVIGVYLGLALGLFHTGAARVRAIF